MYENGVQNVFILTAENRNSNENGNFSLDTIYWHTCKLGIQRKL